jgi:2-isopropylmalate synthase
VSSDAVTISGEGDGPVEAFVNALTAHFGGEFDVVDYAEHAIGRGATAEAVAYVETVGAANEIMWGIGKDPNITTASLRAVLGAFERQHS